MWRLLGFILLLPSLLNAQIKLNITAKVATPTHDSLFIAGSFNDWNPSSKAFVLIQKDKLTYTINLSLPKGNYEFKITRGSWNKAESQPDGKPITNRTINLTVTPIWI